MEHDEAIKIDATERYLLDEMPTAERDAFEDHFFDCIDCAADVRDGARMIATGRDLVSVAPVVPIQGWRRWFPQTAAASVIFAFLGWSGASMTRPVPVAGIVDVTWVQLQTEEERSATAPAQVLPAGRHTVVDFSIPYREEAASYVVTIHDGSGKSWYSAPKSVADQANSVFLLLPALPRGSYNVVIEGVRKDGNRFPITSSELKVGER